MIKILSLIPMRSVVLLICSISHFLMSCFVASYYKSYGTFFTQKSPIISKVALPTTEIIEPIILGLQ